MFGKKFFERVVCADGFSVSVQASSFNYCSPRTDEGPWESVECGFPTKEGGPALEKYAEDPGAGTTRVGPHGEDIETGQVQTVYGWVPSQVVMQIIESHGGMVSGELPEMVPEEYSDPEQDGIDATEAAKEMMDAAGALCIMTGGWEG